jgi:hypothetical protein
MGYKVNPDVATTAIAHHQPMQKTYFLQQNHKEKAFITKAFFRSTDEEHVFT